MLLGACSDLDNYDPPTGTIYGRLIDETSDEPFETEQPNGFRIRYIEQDYINPNVAIQNFHGKADGSFERSDIFPATFKVFPIEGAFFPLTDSATVTVSGRTEVNFNIVPYLHLNATAEAYNGNNIIVRYNISRSLAGPKIMERKALCSHIPTVNNTVWLQQAATNLSSLSDDTILAGSYADTIKALETGKTYYIRAAARTANANNRFNYSKTISITLP